MSDAPAAGGELSTDDAKLVTLARGARARASAAAGAAVMDETGRSYAAASIDLTRLKLSAIAAAVAAAVSSGSSRLESAVVVGVAQLSADDRALLDDLGTARVHVAELDATPVDAADSGPRA